MKSKHPRLVRFGTDPVPNKQPYTKTQVCFANQHCSDYHPETSKSNPIPCNNNTVGIGRVPYNPPPLEFVYC